MSAKREMPSEQLIKQASAEVSVTDSKGRAIVLKKPGVLAQYRLIEVLADSAKNEVYMGMVLPLIYVASLDGVPVMQPANKREVEALISRLDEEGIAAVMEGVQSNFGRSDAEADKDALKK
ncbi:MAG: hypothetical protein ACYC4K_01225 [Thiobacillus sp.]